MKIVVILMLSLLLFSCGGNTDASKYLAERDSILSVNEHQQRELDGINSLMSELTACLDSITEHEQFLYVNKEGVSHSKRTVIENLRSLENLLNRQRKQIAMFKDSLSNLGDKTSQYLKMIDFLNSELAEKELAIKTLKKEVEANRRSLAELKGQQIHLEKSVADLQEREEMHVQALKVQSDMLNECYVKVGTKKELKEAGLLVSAGLFSRKKVDNSKLSKELFMTVDIRNFSELPIPAKKIKIITPEPPAASYSIEKTQDGVVLRIQDPTAFWNASDYLIIQTN